MYCCDSTDHRRFAPVVGILKKWKEFNFDGSQSAQETPVEPIRGCWGSKGLFRRPFHHLTAHPCCTQNVSSLSHFFMYSVARRCLVGSARFHFSASPIENDPRKNAVRTVGCSAFYRTASLIPPFGIETASLVGPHHCTTDKWPEPRPRRQVCFEIQPRAQEILTHRSMF
jgi:hypothetical protein